MSAELRGAKVDMVTTKDNDMKLRRVVNAAPAQNSNDYVIKSQVDDSTNALQTQIDSVNNTLKSNKITVSIIKPPQDSTTAIQITEANGITPVMTIDTIDNFVGVGVSPPASKMDVNGSIITRGVDSTVPTGTVGYGRFSYDIVGNICDVLSYMNGAFQELTIRGTPLILGVTGGKIGFYNAAAQPQQVLNSYTSAPVSTTYFGIATGVAGTPYAQVSDLNTLRAAVENLRLMCDDLRTKLRTSTIVG
jgi:hypothetical protein